MTRDAFEMWRSRGIAAGQRHLANATRTLIFRADESLFDRLDFESDAQFLDPTLFAYFTAALPDMDLPQVLYGLMPGENRPARIRIRTDAAGRAFLGPIGTVVTDLPATDLEFGRCCADAPYICVGGAGMVPFRLQAPIFIPGTQVEVTTDIHPLFRQFYAASEGRQIGVPRDGLVHLIRAMSLLQACCPGLWGELAAAIRLVVLYTAEAPNSFAALSAHGAIFCNVRDGDSELALLEDVVHQGAHVLFNALSHDPRRFLTVDPGTPIHDLSNAGGETRTLYGALHGLFTYTLISRVLAAAYESGSLSERQSHEALGRLGFILEKFESDLRRLWMPDAFTLAGRRCFKAFRTDFVSLQGRHGGRVAVYRYDNQSYVFDYRQFVQANGGPRPMLAERVS